MGPVALPRSGIGCWRPAAATAVDGSASRSASPASGTAPGPREPIPVEPDASVAVAVAVAAAIGAPEPVEATPAPADAVPIQSAPESSSATVSVSIGDEVPTDRLLVGHRVGQGRARRPAWSRAGAVDHLGRRRHAPGAAAGPGCVGRQPRRARAPGCGRARRRRAAVRSRGAPGLTRLTSQRRAELELRGVSAAPRVISRLRSAFSAVPTSVDPPHGSTSRRTPPSPASPRCRASRCSARASCRRYRPRPRSIGPGSPAD